MDMTIMNAMLGRNSLNTHLITVGEINNPTTDTKVVLDEVLNVNTLCRLRTYLTGILEEEKIDLDNYKQLSVDIDMGQTPTQGE